MSKFTTRTYDKDSETYMACGVTMTQAEYERVLKARAEGAKLHTHAELQTFLGHKPTPAPNVTLRKARTEDPEAPAMCAMIPPTPGHMPKGMQAAATSAVQEAAKMFGVGVPIPQHAPGAAHCFSCDSPLEPKAMRCKQCGALVRT